MAEKQLSTLIKQFGLNEKQSQVYLACLELGSATVQELAEKSKVKRTSIYNFLDEMKSMGFLSEIQHHGKTLIVAEDPTVLEERGKEQLKQLGKFMPELKALYNRPGNKPKVRYYQGKEGVRNVYMDLLETGEPVFAFTDYEKMFESFGDWTWFVPEERVKRGIPFKGIARDGKGGRKVKSLDHKQMRVTKLAKDIKFDTEVHIYGNKVSMISFRKPYAGVVIEDPAIALTMKTVWNMVWESLRD